MASDIQMTVDFAEFGKDIQRLAAASRRTTREVVEQQARLIVVDLIKCTPPTGKRPLTESWTFQRQKGERKVDGDVARLFQPLTSIRAVLYPQSLNPKSKNVRRQQLKHLAEQGKWEQLSEMLFFMKITEMQVPVQASLDVEEYRARWKVTSVRGRNIKRDFSERRLVWDSSAVTRVRSEIRLRIGWAKAGWMPAARKLQVTRLPSFVTRHSGAGGIEVEDQGDEFAITVINEVAYIAYLNSGNRLLTRVLRNRQRAMEISLEHAIDHFLQDLGMAA